LIRPQPETRSPPAFAVGIAEGPGHADAIRRANAAGALACLKLGAQPSMPTGEELERFLRERNC